MNRFLQAFLLDIRLQWRHGFHAVYAVVTALNIVAMYQLPPDLRGRAFSLVILNDPAIVGFYFIGGLVLLERDQGMLNSIFITPLRLGEYMLAKVASLTLIALASCLLIAVAVFGTHFHLFPLLAGVILTSTVFILLGFALVSRVKSLNQYLLLSGLYMAILMAPILGWFKVVPMTWFLPIPTTAVLALLDWIKAPQDPWWAAYGLLWLSLLCVLAWRWAMKTFERLVLQRPGGAS